jgi:hypothetical protein
MRRRARAPTNRERGLGRRGVVLWPRRASRFQEAGEPGSPPAPFLWREVSSYRLSASARCGRSIRWCGGSTLKQDARLQKCGVSCARTASFFRRPRRGGAVADRRQRRNQCRRPARPQIWRHQPLDHWPGSRRRPGRAPHCWWLLPQGRRGLRPEEPLRRLGGHARRHHLGLAPVDADTSGERRCRGTLRGRGGGLCRDREYSRKRHSRGRARVSRPPTRSNLPAEPSGRDPGRSIHGLSPKWMTLPRRLRQGLESSSTYSARIAFRSALLRARMRSPLCGGGAMESRSWLKPLAAGR